MCIIHCTNYSLIYLIYPDMPDIPDIPWYTWYTLIYLIYLIYPDLPNIPDIPWYTWSKVFLALFKFFVKTFKNRQSSVTPMKNELVYFLSFKISRITYIPRATRARAGRSWPKKINIEKIFTLNNCFFSNLKTGGTRLTSYRPLIFQTRNSSIKEIWKVLRCQFAKI